MEKSSKDEGLTYTRQNEDGTYSLYRIHYKRDGRRTDVEIGGYSTLEEANRGKQNADWLPALLLKAIEEDE